MSTPNPYAAPKAAVADETVINNADFVPGGQGRPAARGWAWIADSWELFKRQPGMWIGIVLLLFVIMMGAALIPFVGTLAITVFGPVFAAGICIGCRALDNGGELPLAAEAHEDSLVSVWLEGEVPAGRTIDQVRLDPDGSAGDVYFAIEK